MLLAQSATQDGEGASDLASVTTENVQRNFPALVDSITGDVGAFVPEIILSLGICWVILFDLFGRKDRSRLIGYHALGVIGLAFLATLAHGFGDGRSLFRGMIVDDGFASFFKLFILGGTAICVPMIMMQKSLAGRRMGEFYGLLLGAVLGMFLMVTAKNLLMFFMGIEFASYTCYLLAGYMKNDRKASEGGLKYVIYGSVASGIMAYGLSLIYGLTGSLDIAAVGERLAVAHTTDLTLLVACTLCLAGFAYKISAFPMHFWSPDVYQGSPVSFTAFLSVISKAAGFGVLIRFVWAFTSGGSYDLTLADGAVVNMNWPLVIGVVAALTMCVGNFSALFQTNLKRLLAYSSIAHAGYLLMGVAALFPTAGHADRGWDSVLFYLLAYMFMNLGAFLVVAIIEHRTGRETVNDCRGLGKRNAYLAVVFFLFLISLIGLPPTGGFAGKFQLLKAATDGGMLWLAVIAVLNTAVSVYYYARIIKVMFLEEAEESTPLHLSAAMKAYLLLMVVPVIGLGVMFDSTVQFIRNLSFTIG